MFSIHHARSLIALTVAGALVGPVSSMAHARGVMFEGSVGLIFSDNYYDLLRDVYSDHDVSGGFGWIDLGAGVRFIPASRIYVTAGVNFSFASVETEGDDDASYVNFVVTPKVRTQFNFTQPGTFYAAAELTWNIPDSGSDRMDLENNGVGGGIGVGYMFENHMQGELGYRYMPMSVESDFDPELDDDIDLGGPYLWFMYAF